MTPDYVQGTYTTYKKDTDAIANWLATTAKRCGFSPEVLKDSNKVSDQSPSQPQPEVESTRMKGSVRKLAKDTASEDRTKSASPRTYTIPIKSFTHLASQIVSSSSPRIKVPAVLGIILDRAIAFRKEHNACFKNTKLATETPSDIDSHAHFISVLERVRHILRPCMAEKTRTAPPKQSRAHCNRATENNASLSENASKRKPGNAQNVRYQAECMDRYEEHIIATLTLLGSISEIRKHIEGLWEAYLKKDIDLHAAAISTNTAIELVRNLQEDHDKLFHDQPDFQECLVPCFITTCRLFNVDVMKREQDLDLYNFDAYNIADAYFMNTWHILCQLRKWRAVGKVAFVDHLVPKCRDASTEWSQKSARDKILDDKFMLFRAFTGLTALATMDRWVEDEFVRGVRDMSPDNLIPLWLAFAAQIYLDIQNTLGPDLERPYHEMQKAGRFIKANLDQPIAFHEKLSSNPLNPTFCARIRNHMKITSELMYALLIEDGVYFRINGSRSDRRPSFNFFQQNPVLCGIYLFGARYTMQRSSIFCVNEWCTIIYCAHLYNALKVQHLTQRWEDMEVLFKLQGGERIFRGSAPRSIVDCHKRFSLCRSVSIINRASDRRDDGRNQAKLNPNNCRNLEDYIPFASLIAGRYMQYDNCSLSTDLVAVELKIEQMRADKSSKDSPLSSTDTRPNRGASDRPVKATKVVSEQSLTILDFLDGMAEAVQSGGLHLTFDYLRLDRTCCTILIAVEAEVSHKLDDIPPFAGTQGHHALHMPNLVSGILTGAAGMEITWQKILRDDAKYTGETPRAVAESMNKMVEGKAGSVAIEIIKKTFGYE